MTQEVLSASPLKFIVIGSGQVVDKYWLRSVKDGSIQITDIVSLEAESHFRGRNPDFQGTYNQSASVAETLSKVIDLAKKRTSPNVALATPTDIRLELVTGILSCSDQARLFIEKPYADNQTSLDAYRELLARYSPRMHFSGKYANGRANILYSHLPKGVVPEKITGRLIEGTEYFNIVMKKLAAEGKHQYLIDGPELDIGFHLLDIIGVGSDRFGGTKAIQVNKVWDLNSTRPEFEVDYGFGAELEVQTSQGKILVDLQAGKADASNERFIMFDYGDFTVWQEYTVGNSKDPVCIQRGGSNRLVAQHPDGYNYYAHDLHPQVFCHQSSSQQQLSLSNTGICLDIKRTRQRLIQS